MTARDLGVTVYNQPSHGQHPFGEEARPLIAAQAHPQPRHTVVSENPGPAGPEAYGRSGVARQRRGEPGDQRSGQGGREGRPARQQCVAAQVPPDAAAGEDGSEARGEGGAKERGAQGPGSGKSLARPLRYRFVPATVEHPVTIRLVCLLATGLMVGCTGTAGPAPSQTPAAPSPGGSPTPAATLASPTATPAST